MKSLTKALVAIGGIFLGAIISEQVFLSRLENSVIHDDARLEAFLKSLHHPIYVEPSFGFCRFGGSKWGYTYQLCVYSGASSKDCPLDSYIIQYLAPQGWFSVISKGYHDLELVFRQPIFAVDKNGAMCFDPRQP